MPFKASMAIAMGWLIENYTFPTFLLIIGTGIISIYLDSQRMTAKNLHKEAAWARGFGLFYIISSTGLWLALQIAIRLLKIF